MDISKQLLKLSFSGKWEEMNEFLYRHSGSVKINCRSRDKATALIHAVQGARKYKKNQEIDHVKICDSLFQHGADLDLQDQKGRTAVHWAVYYENVNLLSFFIQNDADLEIQDEDGYNCLIFAINSDRIGAIKCICEVDADWETLVDECSGLPPLLYAAELGKIDVVKIFLENNCNVNVIERKKSQRTALHIAIQLERYDIFELLMRHGAKANIKDGGGKTVLKRAASHVNSLYLQLLLADEKMSSESVNESGCTALMLACQAENITNVNSILENRVDASVSDRSGKTALHHCVENKSIECAAVILDYDSSILNIQDNDGYSCLHLAVITGNTALLELLIDRGANINSTDNEKHTVVHWATVCGQFNLLDIVINKSAVLSTPDIHNAYPLHYAAQMAGMNSDGINPDVGMKILQKLLSKGIPVDVTDRDNRQPLLWAASAGSSDACVALINAGAKVGAADKDGLTALHCAASRGHPECIQTLIEQKAVIDCKDKNECSPLFYAITLNHDKCALLLLELGANPSFQDKKGRSPAHCAAAKGFISCLSLLKEKKANLWLKNNRGEYPLHEGAQSGHTDAVNFLVQEAKDSKEGLELLSRGNSDGRTCLHVAAMTNHLELIKLLLDNGANVNSVMKSKSKNEYYTPYDAAMLKGNMECAEYLRSHGAATGQKVTGYAAKKIQSNFRRSNRKTRKPKKSDTNTMEVLNKEESEIFEVKAENRENKIEVEENETENSTKDDMKKNENNDEREVKDEFVVESTLDHESELDDTILKDEPESEQKDESSSDSDKSDDDMQSSSSDYSSSSSDSDENEDRVDVGNPEEYEENKNVSIEENAKKTDEIKQIDEIKRTDEKSDNVIEDVDVPSSMKDEESVHNDSNHDGDRDERQSVKHPKEDNINSQQQQGEKSAEDSKNVHVVDEHQVKDHDSDEEFENDHDSDNDSKKDNVDDEDRKKNHTSDEDSIKDHASDVDSKKDQVDDEDRKKDHASDEDSKKDPSYKEEEELSIKAAASPEVCEEHLYKKDDNQQKPKSEKQKNLHPIRNSTASKPSKSEHPNNRPKTSLRRSDDGLPLKSPRNPPSGKSKIAKSVQDSVRNFEYTRMVVKELHRLRKAQIHKDRNQDIVVIRRFIEQYRKDGKFKGEDPEINTMDDWEKYLREQLKFLTYLQQDKPAFKEISPLAKDEQRRFEKEAHEAHERQKDENYRRKKKFKEKEDNSHEKREKTDKEIIAIAERTNSLFNNANETADELLCEAHASNKDLETASSKKSLTSSSPSKRRAMQQRTKALTANNNLIRAYRPQFHPGVYENTYKLQNSGSKPKSSYGNRGHQKGGFPQINGHQKRTQSSKPFRPAPVERKLSPAQFKLQSQSYPRGLSHQESGPSNNSGDSRPTSKSNNDKLPASFSPRYDGGIRPRSELVFISPEDYQEKIRRHKTHYDAQKDVWYSWRHPAPENSSAYVPSIQPLSVRQ